jgi:transposase
VISSHSYNDYHDGHIPGVHIEFLSSYSPNFNPIKEGFSKIKHFLHHHHATTDDGILYNMYKIVDIITPDDVHSYFVYAGYF